MYLHDFLRPHTSGQGGAGPNDARGESSHEKTTPHTSLVPLLSIGQLVTHSATPPRPTVSAPTNDQCTPDRTKEGVDAEPASIDIVEATFPRYSCVTSTGTIQTTFWVEKELVPIKIEKIPGNYSLLKLVFIILL